MRKQILLDHGIKTLNDLLSFEGEIKGISQKLLDKFKTMAKNMFPYNKPDALVHDYKKSTNPYSERNLKNWGNEIKKVSHMSAYVCITDLIQFIYDESKKVMEGTKFVENW